MAKFLSTIVKYFCKLDHLITVRDFASFLKGPSLQKSQEK
jgi:hypothetical protein